VGGIGAGHDQRRGGGVWVEGSHSYRESCAGGVLSQGSEDANDRIGSAGASVGLSVLTVCSLRFVCDRIETGNRLSKGVIARVYHSNFATAWIGARQPDGYRGVGSQNCGLMARTGMESEFASQLDALRTLGTCVAPVHRGSVLSRVGAYWRPYY
jgi:hypothetical protein